MREKTIDFIARDVDLNLIKKAKKTAKEKGLLYEPVKKVIVENGIKQWIKENEQK